MDFFILTSGADATTTANFWDFSTANQAGLTLNQLRPSNLCAYYADTWHSAPAGGLSLAAMIRSPGNVRIAAGAYRATNFNAAYNQKLFGFQMLVSTAGATQGGGSLEGCPDAVGLTLDEGIPQSATGASTTMLCNYCCGFGGCTPGPPPIHVAFNDPTVGTVRHTWAQLKSLYR
jgi:hypothetical protein